MTVFRVKLNTTQQGLLDLQAPAAAPGLGSQFAVSKQRTVFIMGPGKCQRLLKDGDTFTDCNYYKRFCYPALPLDKAFLEVVTGTDDGNEWSDVPGEMASVPYVVSKTIAKNTSYAANTVDFVATYGGPATFCQIENTSGTLDVSVKLNGRSQAVFTLAHGQQQIFDRGDLLLSTLSFANANSGNGEDVVVQLMFGIEAKANS